MIGGKGLEGSWYSSERREGGSVGGKRVRGENVVG